MSRINIYRSANVLIRQHGEDAAIEAAMRADAMLEKGDLEGQAVWKRIVRAVEPLRFIHCISPIHTVTRASSAA